MEVLPTQSTDTAVASTAAAKTDATSSDSFKAALAKASDEPKMLRGKHIPEGVKLRDGETIRDVRGRQFVKVMSGDRKGMYINATGNEHNGQAFVLVRKGGKEYHVYGSGKDRLVVQIPWKNTQPETANADKGLEYSDIHLRKGEKLEPVKGHWYAEIVSGPRKGMYVNTSFGARRGEAFVLVEKKDADFHIYGSGDDRVVIRKPHKHHKAADPSALSDIKLLKGEKIEPVEDHKYAEIVAGPRKGMYINTSSNARRGEAFVLVEKADFDYHIYGSGNDRVVIRASKTGVERAGDK